MRGLSLVAASGGHSSSQCVALSLSRPLLLRSTGSRHAGSVVVAQGPSCSAACGIFPDQGSKPCPLHWQADSQPLRHQGSPQFFEHTSVFPPQDLRHKCLPAGTAVSPWACSSFPALPSSCSSDPRVGFLRHPLQVVPHPHIPS